jgi:hypothetical protein
VTNKVKCASPDCSKTFLPKNSRHVYCSECSAAREVMRKAEYRKAHLGVSAGPKTLQASDETLRAQAEIDHAELIQKEQAGLLDVVPPVPTLQPQAPRELSAAELQHLMAEPDISAAALAEIEDPSQRLEAHKDWQKAAAKIESHKHVQPVKHKLDDDFHLDARPERKTIDPVIEEMRASQGKRDIILYMAGGFKFTRDLQGRPIPSQLRQDKHGRWIEPDGLGGQQELAEGSSVTVRKIEPWPGDGFLLTSAGVWLRPASEIVGWTEALRTPSGRILYADGTKAILRQVEGMYFDQFDRIIQLKDAPECPDSVVPENFYFTDEGKWISKAKWLARDVYATMLKSAIAEAKESHADYTALEAELEIFEKHHVTIPDVIQIPASIPTQEEIKALPVPKIKLPQIVERPQQFNRKPQPPTKEEIRKTDIQRAMEMHDGLEGSSINDEAALETVAAMGGYGANATEKFTGHPYKGSDPAECRKEVRRIRQEQRNVR